MKAAVDEDLTGRVRAHLASTGLALSSYELARVLGLARSSASNTGSLWRALAELERRGEVMRVTEAKDENDRRLVTRWKADHLALTIGVALDQLQPRLIAGQE